jgi:hypothetical protein
VIDVLDEDDCIVVVDIAAVQAVPQGRTRGVSGALSVVRQAMRAAAEAAPSLRPEVQVEAGGKRGRGSAGDGAAQKRKK